MRIFEINPGNYGNYQNNFASILKQPALFAAFSKNCPHCQDMKPQWDNLKKKLSNEKCNAGLIEVDSNVAHNIPIEAIKNRINGFPTIMIIKKGKPVQEYSGDRSEADMYSFFKKYLSEENKSKPKKSHTIGSKTMKKLMSLTGKRHKRHKRHKKENSKYKRMTGGKKKYTHSKQSQRQRRSNRSTRRRHRTRH